MAKVNAYRVSCGIGKFESPYEYIDPEVPHFGDVLSAKGRQIASRNAMMSMSEHEGGQIGATCGYWFDEKPTAAETAECLYELWYNSPAHNANMLTTTGARHNSYDVAVMHVYEYFNGNSYTYAAVMTVSMGFEAVAK